MTQTITLCMIAKNEEEKIANAIESVKKIVDEIVLVDTGSTDKTKEIAKSLDAKVYDYNWDDDFSDARNFSLSKCTSDWILILDCDEVIAKDDLDKIKELVEDKLAIAYKFIQRSYEHKKTGLKWNDNDNKYSESRGYAGWQYRGIVRLFRNDKRIKFEYNIHETVKPSILKIGKILNSDIPIHHFPKNTKQKEKMYLGLLKDKVKEYKNANAYAELAIHLYGMGKLDEAREYAKKATELNSKINLGPILK